MSNHIHLVGVNPDTQETLLPEFPLTDRFWEETEKAFQTLGCSRTINSLPVPFEGDEIPLGLQFVLKSSDHFGDETTVAGKIRDDGTIEKMSYNVILRLLRELAVPHKLWFGILPEARSCEMWKRFVDIPTKEQTELDGCLAPDMLTAGFVGEPKVFLPTGTFSHPVHVGTLKVNIPETKGHPARELILPDNVPFVAIILTEDDTYTNSWNIFPIVANHAFLELCTTDPKQADRMFLDALADGFHYQNQTEDQQYCSWYTFSKDYESNISERFNTESSHKAALEKAKRAIRKIARSLISKEVDELYPEILHGCAPIYKKPKLHLKSFRLEKSGIYLDATVETQERVVKVKINPTGTTWQTTLRARKPTT